MPKKQLDILTDGPAIIDLLKPGQLRDAKEITIQYKDTEIKLTTEQQTPQDRLLMLLIFHKTLYTLEGFSGDVKFWTFPPKTWKQQSPDNLVFLTSIYNRTYSSKPRERKIEMRGLTYYYKCLNTEGSSYGETYAALFSVGRDVMVEYAKIALTGIDGEEDIVKMILAAGRVSKMVSRALIPVFDLHGNIIEAVPLGMEDVIFPHLLTYMLAEYRRKKFDREERRNVT
jgi:hypothetical protein